MRLRGGGGGGGEGLSLAICMMSSMQEGNGGAYGKPLCRAYGEGKTAAKKKNLERGTHISTETNCGGAQPMSARASQSRPTNGRAGGGVGVQGWPEDMAPP